VNLKTYQELSRVGNNLNQLVRALHRGEVSQAGLAQIPELESLRTLLKEIGLQVLGVSAVPAMASLTGSA